MEKNKRVRWIIIFWKAIINGNNDIFELLLAWGNIDINEQDHNKETALMLAVSYDRFDMFKRILSHKDIRVNALDDCDYSALLLAVDHQKVEMVKLLLSMPNIDVNVPCDTGMTALMFAASCNFAVITELLLDRSNVNIWWRDEDGFTAVDYAIKEGFAEILKLFLVRGMFIAPLARIKCSDEIATMIRNKKHYLPRWSRFNTCKYYPREFNFVIARVWLLCCKRSKLLRKLSRDVWYLMIEYFAEAWKQSWDREDVIKGLRKEIEILNKVKIQLY